MVARRDILLGVGATAGCGALAFAAHVTRIFSHGPYDLGGIGAAVDDQLAGQLACTNGKLTTGQIEGPFFTAKSPLRRDIRNSAPKMATFVLSGRVVDKACRPIAGALLDFWQTRDQGGYDNQGYGYRGHQFTDDQGRFELVTVRPSAYTAINVWRAPHIHVKVQGPSTQVLTTQLYMPDELEFNAQDNWYDATLDVRLAGKNGDAELAHFDFVMEQA